jgi:toxin ParE2
MPAIKVDPAVYPELDQARGWDGQQSPGLGTEFLDEVDRALEAILRSPQTWPPFTHQTRRFLLHRFPYAIVYHPKSDLIHIVAVMHLHRKPGYWKNLPWGNWGGIGVSP